MIKLVINSGFSKEEKVFTDPIVTVGSGKEEHFDLTIHDDAIKGECIQFISDDDNSEYFAINLSHEEDDVTVNGNTFGTYSLSDGDIFKIGNTTIIFESFRDTTQDIIKEIDDILSTPPQEEVTPTIVVEEIKEEIPEPEPEEKPEPEEELKPELEPKPLPEEIIIKEDISIPEIIEEDAVEEEIEEPLIREAKTKNNNNASPIVFALILVMTLATLGYIYNLARNKYSSKHHVVRYTEHFVEPVFDIEEEEEEVEIQIESISPYSEVIHKDIEALSSLYQSELQHIEHTFTNLKAISSSHQYLVNRYKKIEAKRRSDISLQLDLLYAKFIVDIPQEHLKKFYTVVQTHNLELFMSQELTEQLKEQPQEPEIRELIAQINESHDLIELDKMTQQLYQLLTFKNVPDPIRFVTLKNNVRKNVLQKLDSLLMLPKDKSISMMTQLKSYASIEHILNNAEILEGNIRSFYLNEFGTPYN